MCSVAGLFCEDRLRVPVCARQLPVAFAPVRSTQRLRRGPRWGGLRSGAWLGVGEGKPAGVG
jgi:hypothetical protein